MKILHINCNYIGTALHRIMINHLEDAEFKNTVFVPIYSKEQKKVFNSKSNEKVSVCFNKWDRLFYFLKQKKIQNAIESCCEPISQYNCVHAYTLLTDGNSARYLGKKYGIPYFVAIRDTDINDFFRLKPYLKPLGVRIMRDANKIYFLSEAYRKNVLEKHVPAKYRTEIENKSLVIPNGIDDFWLDNRFTNRNYKEIEKRINNKEIKIICVGKICKRKNIPFLQKALAILRSQGWKVSLTVVGEIESQNEMAAINKDPFTTYILPTNKQGLIKYYRDADLFVLASHTETFGLVYAEAMSQGLPVIYTREQGFDGQFPEGTVGYAVSDKDPTEIPEAIKRICKNYTLFSNNALENAESFRWSQICNQYRIQYRGLQNE